MRISLTDLGGFSADFMNSLEPRKDRATIITLSGPLGSGKTTFVQHLAQNLGVKENITSPTYVLLKTYQLPNTTYHQLVHIDAYRLSSGEDLEMLNWEHYYQDPGNLIVIEWPEQVKGLEMQPDYELSFEHAEEGAREIKILNTNNNEQEAR